MLRIEVTGTEEECQALLDVFHERGIAETVNVLLEVQIDCRT